ncbi:MAG TPA: hypothetical protein VGB83_04685 [Actinomycetota bacterium]
MRRRLVAGLATAAALVSMFGGMQPASATHGCTAADCYPATVAVLEGGGLVCNRAVSPTDAQIPNGFGFPSAANWPQQCAFQSDELWDARGGGPAPFGQGLYWPGAGPPATGPFSFVTDHAAGAPNGLCVSSANGPGCEFKSFGLLSPGSSGYGAYCGSSLGKGFSEFRSGLAGDPVVKANFGWDQSAATILPLEGEVRSPAALSGGSVTGFVSSRGTNAGSESGGNCGITASTFKFQVEGMIITY